MIRKENVAEYEPPSSWPDISSWPGINSGLPNPRYSTPQGIHRYDKQKAEEWVQAGKVPPPTDFSAPTHQHYRDLLVEVRDLALEQDLDGLKSSSRIAILDYRDLCIRALEQVIKKSLTMTALEQTSEKNLTMTAENGPLNVILYGPPGTGKTYATIEQAVEILDPPFLNANRDNRKALKARFDELSAAGDVRFVTFHQSFSYEDFVEGLRAERDDDGQLNYVVADGVFKTLCKVASESNPSASAGSSGPPFQSGERFGGYEVAYASNEIVELIKPNGNRLPIGMSLLRELATYVREDKLTIKDIKERRVFEKVADTHLEPYLVNGYENILPLLVERLIAIEKPTASAHSNSNQPKVLIIDEINRGSVSRIFGELITLIEPSKRKGAPEALSVTLPYSKERFSVPSNLHLIGTMNTADRSLTGLDIALRRRFAFREMPPQPDLLNDADVLGVNTSDLLRVMNDRIEILLDRDHRLGHTYFLPLIEEPSLDLLGIIFRQQILPLLQEYFFEDWSRIQLVLNDHRKSVENRFVTPRKPDPSLFGNELTISDKSERWLINEDAFDRIEAYLGIIDDQFSPPSTETEREAIHKEFTIRQMPSGTIELTRDGNRVEPARQSLIEIARELGLETRHQTGTQLNTRALGKRIIDALQAGHT
jgi:5-methylcytosine-specific restriction enzyme B